MSDHLVILRSTFSWADKSSIGKVNFYCLTKTITIHISRKKSTRINSAATRHIIRISLKMAINFKGIINNLEFWWLNSSLIVDLLVVSFSVGGLLMK